MHVHAISPGVAVSVRRLVPLLERRLLLVSFVQFERFRVWWGFQGAKQVRVMFEYSKRTTMRLQAFWLAIDKKRRYGRMFCWKVFNCNGFEYVTFRGTRVLHNLWTQQMYLMGRTVFHRLYIYTFWAQCHEQRSNNHTVHRTIIMLDFKLVLCFHVFQTIPYPLRPSPHRAFRAQPHLLYHQPPSPR